MLQFQPVKGAIAENLSRIRGDIAEAAGEVDLLVLPETIVSGYHVEGGIAEVARSVDEIVAGLGSPPAGAPDVVLGFYESGREGHFNSALYLEAGADAWDVRHVHRKIFLPTYGVFQEARFVAPGLELAAFDTRFGRVGLLVCEELLHSICPAILCLDGAETLICLSATPARGFRPGSALPGNLERWDAVGRATALEHGAHLLVAHLVGSEGGKLFAGGSVVHGPGGEVLARGPLFREGVVEVTLDPSAVVVERERSPLLRDLRVMSPHLQRSWNAAEIRREEREAGKLAGPPVVRGARQARDDDPSPRPPVPIDPDDHSPLEVDGPLLEEALVSFLRDEVVVGRGFSEVVVGVSGGVDSAVTLALAAKAFGPDHVHAFLLPYRTSSPESLEDGQLVAAAFGVGYRTIDITGSVDAYVNVEEPESSTLRRGNVAARVRSIVLWDQAARVGGLPLGTGNKSERLMGFYTWHADDAPPVNPLGDLFKTQVWALARHLGVPRRVIEKAPTPDLVQGVSDEDELGVTYAVADRILHWTLMGVAPGRLVESGFDAEAVALVRRRLDGTHWKRHLPTVAMVSSTSIGDYFLRPVDY